MQLCCSRVASIVWHPTCWKFQLGYVVKLLLANAAALGPSSPSSLARAKADSESHGHEVIQQGWSWRKTEGAVAVGCLLDDVESKAFNDDMVALSDGMFGSLTGRALQRQWRKHDDISAIALDCMAPHAPCYSIAEP